MKKTLLFFVLLIICGSIYSKSQKDTLKIYFNQGIYEIHNINNNYSTFEELRNLLENKNYNISSINLVSSTSPEGELKLNKNLAQLRANSVIKYLKSLNIDLEKYNLKISYLAPDWDFILNYMKNSKLPFSSRCADIIINTPENIMVNGRKVELRKNKLKKVEYGLAWDFLNNKIFKELRKVSIIITSEVPMEHNSMEKNIVNKKNIKVSKVVDNNKNNVSVDTVGDVLILKDTVISNSDNVKKPYYLGVKTNLLYDLALVPNLGVEIYWGKNISTVFNWSYSWWYTDVKHYYWQTYGGDMEFRYWFGKLAAQKPLTGLHVGAYAQMRTYDVEFGYKGWQGATWHYGGGLSLGYALPVGKRINIDFNIGLGYFGGTYKTYIPRTDYYLWQSTNKLKYFGPTKAEISLIWLIGRGNYNKK